jgi:hypothetical protein
MIPENLKKAILREISWDSRQDPIDGPHWVEVQFNPESLKLALSNQNASGDQRGGSAIQYVGAGTSKLSFDLWFDVTGLPGGDVRDLTNEVVFFMTPKATDEADKFIPPGVRFLWGSFLFEGIMDSLSEDLEYFSEDGRPLRAKLAISMSRQEIRFEEGRQQGGSGLGTQASSGRRQPSAARRRTGGGGRAKSTSRGSNQQVRDGDTVPGLAGEDWPAVAAANGIENPLDLEPGTILDLGDGHSLGGGLADGASFDDRAPTGGGLRAGAVGGATQSGGLGAGGAGSTGAGLSTRASITAERGGAASRAAVSASASFDIKLRR